MIKVFSAEGCSGCLVIKDLITSLGYEFEVKDIMKSEVMEEAAQLGIRGVPVTLIDDEMIIGSSPLAINRIKELLK